MADNYARYVEGDAEAERNTCGAARPGLFQIRCTRTAGHGPAIDPGVGEHLPLLCLRISRVARPSASDPREGG